MSFLSDYGILKCWGRPPLCNLGCSTSRNPRAILRLAASHRCFYLPPTARQKGLSRLLLSRRFRSDRLLRRIAATSQWRASPRNSPQAGYRRERIRCSLHLPITAAAPTSRLYSDRRFTTQARNWRTAGFIWTPCRIFGACPLSELMQPLTSETSLGIEGFLYFPLT